MVPKKMNILPYIQRVTEPMSRDREPFSSPTSDEEPFLATPQLGEQMEDIR